MTRWRAVSQVAHRYGEVPYISMLALWALNGATTLLISPKETPVYHLAVPWDYAWAVLYAGGGILILTGVGARLAHLEAAGCVAFAGGSLVNALATAAVQGWAAWNTTVLLSVFCAASLVRARHLAQGRVLILVSPGGRARER